MNYYLYIIETIDNMLYCGIAINPIKRFLNHKNKKGAKFFFMHKPKEIIYLQWFQDKASALKEEYKIKKTLSKTQKLNLIKENQENTKKLLEELSKETT